MGNHTPTPWHVGELNGSGIQVCHSDNSPGAISKNLAIITARQTWLKEAEANAEFIVRACNSHYALVTALKEARSIVNYAASGMTHSGEMTNTANRILAIVDATLTAVGVRP